MLTIHRAAPWALAALVLASHGASAAGISVDAGLTPPEDRWIIRTQLRTMRRADDAGSGMTTFTVPVVLVYGLRPDLTVLARLAYARRDAGGASMNGFTDLRLLAKYRLLRLNTREFTIGLAPVLSLELPVGQASFGSHTWDGSAGIFLSGRHGPWGVDLNLSYSVNGLGGPDPDGTDPGDQLTVDVAFARQISLDADAAGALAPVLELSYARTWPDKEDGADTPGTGEGTVLLSPGFKLSFSSWFFEALLQIPVWSETSGTSLPRRPGVILGIRLLH